MTQASTRWERLSRPVELCLVVRGFSSCLPSSTGSSVAEHLVPECGMKAGIQERLSEVSQFGVFPK